MLQIESILWILNESKVLKNALKNVQTWHAVCYMVYDFFVSSVCLKTGKLVNFAGWFWALNIWIQLSCQIGLKWYIETLGITALLVNLIVIFPWYANESENWPFPQMWGKMRQIFSQCPPPYPFHYPVHSDLRGWQNLFVQSPILLQNWSFRKLLDIPRSKIGITGVLDPCFPSL